MAAPFAHGAEEIVYGFLFGPEVAQELAGVAGKHDALGGDQFVNGRMSVANVLFSA